MIRKIGDDSIRRFDDSLSLSRHDTAVTDTNLFKRYCVWIMWEIGNTVRDCAAVVGNFLADRGLQILKKKEELIYMEERN